MSVKKIAETIEKLSRDFDVRQEERGRLLTDLAEWFAKVLPESFDQFDDGLLRWSRYGVQSRIGCLGPSLWLVDGPHRVVLVSTARKPGSEFYLHGDLNARVKVGDIQDFSKAATDVPALLIALQRELERALEKADCDVSLLERVLRKLEEVKQ